MKRRRIFEEDRQAVSPVIATILMVAITVVLAATLYMMIDTGDDGGTAIFSGAMSVHSRDAANGNLTMRVTSMRSPSSAPEADVRITVFDQTGASLGQITPDWVYQPNSGEVSEGARFILDISSDPIESFRNYEIELRLDGVEGSITHTVS